MSKSSASGVSSGQAAVDQRSPQPYIVVEGFGSIDVTPDYGAASLAVEIERRDLPDARREANQRMNAVLAALSSLNVPDKDIQTSRFSIDIVQNYLDRRRVFEGYRVTHRLRVRARPPERLGEVIDAAFEAGASEIGGIGFFADDPESAYRESRNRAVSDALARANQLAELTGVKLGPPLQIEEPPRDATEESSGRAHRTSGFATMSSVADLAPPTTISPGEGPVGVYVRIYFAIA